LMIKELLANRDTHYQSKLALMERIREYADHKWDCSVKHNQGCSCGWVELRDALHKLDEASA
jgi:hypothetical protein